SDSRIASGEERLNQFQVSNRYGVQHETVLPLVEANSVNMIELAALRRPHIMKNGASRRCRCRFSRQSEAFEGKHTEVIFQQRNRVIGGKHPVVQRCVDTLKLPLRLWKREPSPIKSPGGRLACR